MVPLLLDLCQERLDPPHALGQIVVAQRVSTITGADLILVLDEGRLTAAGTHEELLEASRTYREIVISQLGSEAFV